MVRILVIGASGLIGSAVCSRLVTDGHEVMGASRRPPSAALGQMKYVAFDLATVSEAHLASLITGVDAVVNCAGILQDALGESTHGVHERGVATLITACARQ